VEKYSGIRHIFKENAVYLAGNPKLNHLLRSSKKRKEGKPSVFPHSGDHTPDDLEFIRDMIEQNNLKVQIDTVFKLNDIIDAFQLVLSGNKQGNIAVKCF